MSDHLDRLRVQLEFATKGPFETAIVAPADLAALLSERDALAAVAEAARDLVDDEKTRRTGRVNALGYVALSDALAAYDRTVAKP